MGAGDRHCQIELVLFRCGGHRFALEAARVQAMHRAAGASDAARLDSLLGLPPAAAPGLCRELLVRRDEGSVRLLVEEPVELRAVPCASLHLPPPLLAARSVLPLAAIYLEAEAAVPVLMLK